MATRLCLPLGMIAIASGCSLGNQGAPTPVGPSGPALAVTLSASPDILRAMAVSQSSITVTAYNPDGSPRKDLTLRISVASTPTPEAGQLSVNEVKTGADGKATFAFTAPTANQNVSEAVITVVPVGDDFANARERSVRVALAGPAIPIASFTFLPAGPAIGETVTFDATASTLTGVSCGTACTYSWSFGDGGTATGQIVTHAFATHGLQTITMTVTATEGGTSATTTRTLTVTTPNLPTATFTVSPAAPRSGTPVQFDAAGSTVGTGATIVEYSWVWGDLTANTVTASPQTQHTFPASAVAATYVVRLTTRDSLNRTATSTTSVLVAP